MEEEEGELEEGEEEKKEFLFFLGLEKKEKSANCAWTKAEAFLTKGKRRREKFCVFPTFFFSS